MGAKTMIDAPSPNFGARAKGKKISFLILHYTGMPTAEESLRIMQDPKHQAAAHYMVDEQGRMYQLVSEDKRAWHAGKSYWAGEEDINSCSIGIEIQNPGHEHGYTRFPRQQIDAVVKLSSAIIKRHHILPQNVLAHSDVAPARKQDPGELFPWKELAARGVGLWPRISKADKIGETKDIRTLLERYGYDGSKPRKTLVTAFQRHFQPDIFKEPEHAGTPDLETVYLARALLRLKQGG